MRVLYIHYIGIYQNTFDLVQTGSQVGCPLHKVNCSAESWILLRCSSRLFLFTVSIWSCAALSIPLPCVCYKMESRSLKKITQILSNEQDPSICSVQVHDEESNLWQTYFADKE